MRSLVLMSVLVSAVAPAAAHAPVAVPDGHVYFWSDPNQTGAAGAWDYAPPGYKEAGSQVKRHAYSFESKATGTVYAISYPSSGPCLYRPILPEEYSTNWVDWATKLDGVSDTTMGCQAG